MDLKRLTPNELKKLADQRLLDIVAREIPRSVKRVNELRRRYPSAPNRELAQRLIDEKKSLAGMVGGISGVFGIFSIPADLLVMAWLELVLHTDIATVYRANLKSDHGRGQILDLFGENYGVGKLTRSTPRAVGTTLGYVLSKGGLKTVGRAVPVIAAPISAWLNNRHIQAVGEATIAHFEGFDKARRKKNGGDNEEPAEAIP
ncbi:MAG: hypothetical protein IRZ16_19355 [Myxococcaceae bacterium]|nr:hypothetical protein [Myxococcaceae bacterium]